MQIHAADILIFLGVFASPTRAVVREFFSSRSYSPLSLLSLYARFSTTILFLFLPLLSSRVERGSATPRQAEKLKEREKKEKEKTEGRKARWTCSTSRRPPLGRRCQRFLIILFVNDPGPLIGQRDDTNRSFFHTYVWRDVNPSKRRDMSEPLVPLGG